MQSNLSNWPLNLSLYPKMIQSSNQSNKMLRVKSPIYSPCAHSHAVIFLILASVIIISVSWFTRTEKFSHVEPAQVGWLNNIPGSIGQHPQVQVFKWQTCASAAKGFTHIPSHTFESLPRHKQPPTTWAAITQQTGASCWTPRPPSLETFSEIC